MPRTVKQKWVFERLFNAKGSLEGMVTRLSQLKVGDSILPAESQRMANIAAMIRDLQDDMDEEYTKHLSWKQFERKNVDAVPR